MARSVQNPQAELEEGSRRSFLTFTGVIGAVIGVMVGFPVALLFGAPLDPSKRNEAQWVEVGDLSDFDQPKEVEYSFPSTDGWYHSNRSRRVLVRKVSATDFDVISTSCTHVGCGVQWVAEQQKFFCPCHGGEFSADGKVLKGPPKAPLQKLEARVNPKSHKLEVKEA